MPWPEDATLKGELVTIAPLEHAHTDDLKEATSDGELHRLWYTTAPSAETMTKDIDGRLAMRKAGSMLPFSVFLNETGKAVGRSGRTLQRKLSADGFSYQQLIDDARRTLAERLLQKTEYSLQEIAFLTGFSEQSAFTRAFKRWAGQTPRSFRLSASR